MLKIILLTLAHVIFWKHQSPRQEIYLTEKNSKSYLILLDNRTNSNKTFKKCLNLFLKKIEYLKKKKHWTVTSSFIYYFNTYLYCTPKKWKMCSNNLTKPFEKKNRTTLHIIPVHVWLSLSVYWNLSLDDWPKKRKSTHM